MRILVAEDDPASALFLERTLTDAGHAVTVASAGLEALGLLGSRSFDLLLTDWMMPGMSGMELIARAKALPDTPGLTIILTAISMPEARGAALSCGADAFLTKPSTGAKILETIRDCQGRRQQPAPVVSSFLRTESGQSRSTDKRRPAFPCGLVAASTGGPQALGSFFSSVGNVREAAFLVVQHGPAWMMDSLAALLAASGGMPACVARNGQTIEPGRIYLAPGDFHMTVTPDQWALRLDQEPPENFVRPAADRLFRSAAPRFGRWGLATVLTGLGRDGTLGAEHVSLAGGAIFAQDPATCVAPSMSRTLIGARLARHVLPLQELGVAVARHLVEAARDLAGGASMKMGKTDR